MTTYFKNNIIGLVMGLVAIAILPSCSTNKKASMNVLVNNHTNKDAIKEYALCDCLYEVGNYTKEERSEDGSYVPYIEFSSLGIEKLKETDVFVKQYLDTMHLSSANNSTLALRECFMMYQSKQLDRFANGKPYSFGGDRRD